ncbi:hypothetical protein quinque_011283 [Culex quinquefasciatus]
MKLPTILWAIFSLGLTTARFTSLGIKEMYLPHCESELVFTTGRTEKCYMRKLEIDLPTDEKKVYVKCVLESFQYLTGKEGKFDGQALLKDYHQVGIKDRDKAVLESYQNCMKNYGFPKSPIKMLDCITKDKDFSRVINAKREKNKHWQAGWLEACC